MTREELLKKWNELTTLYIDKETKLEAYIQKWLDGNSSLNDDEIQQLIDSTNEQINQLKSMANKIISEEIRIGKEQSLREQGLFSAKRTVREQLGTNPDEIIITNGLLSPKASESHMIGRQKTEEELEQERQSALANVRNQVATKQISLAEASKLKNDINLAYGYSSQNQDILNKKHN